MKTFLPPLLTAALSLPFAAMAEQAVTSDWDAIVKEAEGQTVYFNAWGGSPQINQYLRWADKELQQQYDVRLVHVKVNDIAETVNRLVAEKAAGKHSGGSVDLVWVNGENFKSLKHNDLLWGPFVDTLPSWQFIDKSLPVDVDFTEPTEGLEAPWGVGQLVFIYDTDTLASPPNSFAELLTYAKSQPGRISYPQPPEFHGSSFLKAALLELSGNDAALYQPVDAAKFDQITAPLWHYLDQLHPLTWQQGARFPTSSGETKQLLNDGQIDLAITFNPNDALAGVANGTLPASVDTFAFEQGALSNIHFLAIPWNSDHSAGAQVVVDFLLSPEAQTRKANADIWGDPAVVATEFLTGESQGFALFPSLPEPHPSWQTALEKEWQERYGSK
uniref:ABC transporter substrate-binding protein n=1 Tax=Thaumasiovibrio occultus TaxID=1891184 RepID=UPI000B34F299|nr:ABC transporter substrate-binding protein [Thaumasiovibrio occultus]